MFDYIESFYNPVRLHTTLDYLSPIEYVVGQQDAVRGLVEGGLARGASSERYSDAAGLGTG